MILNKIKFIWSFLILTILTLLLTYCLPTPHRYASGILNPFQRLSSTAHTEGDEGDEETDIEPDEALNDEEQSDDDDEENTIDITKIPYDLRIDTMAYMTYHQSNTYQFKFKVGAFQQGSFKGGIRLKKYFVDKYGDSISDIKQYPYYKSSLLLNLVDNSDYTQPYDFEVKFKFYNPQIATLNSSKLKILLNQALDAEEDQIPYSKLINQLPISAELIYNNKYLHRHLNEYKFFAGFQSHEGLPHYYTHDNEEYIHGRYYTIKMTHKSDFVHVLKTVTEENPATEEELSWNCNYKYKILRHSKENESDSSKCPEVSPPEENDSNYKKYKLVERVLKDRESDSNKWNINIDAKCISPKSSSNRYYPEGVVNVTTSGCETGFFYKYCPHYLSICILGAL